MAILHIGRDHEVMPLAGSGPGLSTSKGRRVPARPDRQSPAHHSRRAHFQHGIALGRRCARWPMRWRAQAPSGGHAAATVGAGWWAASRAPVRRETSAHHRRAERRRARYAIFLLPLRSCALNGAALRAVGYTKDTPDPAGRRDPFATAEATLPACCCAKPNAGILYATLAKGPKLAR